MASLSLTPRYDGGRAYLDIVVGSAVDASRCSALPPLAARPRKTQPFSFPWRKEASEVAWAIDREGARAIRRAREVSPVRACEFFDPRQQKYTSCNLGRQEARVFDAGIGHRRKGLASTQRAQAELLSSPRNIGWPSLSPPRRMKMSPRASALLALQ